MQTWLLSKDSPSEVHSAPVLKRDAENDEIEPSLVPLGGCRSSVCKQAPLEEMKEDRREVALEREGEGGD